VTLWRSRNALLGNGNGSGSAHAGAGYSAVVRPAPWSLMSALALSLLLRVSIVWQGAAYTTNFMERENDEHVNLLHGKVSALKEMTIQIGDHVRNDNAMLDGMGSEFDRTNSLLSGTMKRLDALAQTKNGRHMIYLALFVIVVFFVLWVSRRR